MGCIRPPVACSIPAHAVGDSDESTVLSIGEYSDACYVLAIDNDGELGTVPGAPATNITVSGGGTLQSATNDVTLSANRNISLTGAATLNSNTSGKTLTVGGTINGTQALTLAGAGNITLAGVVGGTTALSSITQQSSAGTTTINANVTTGSGGASLQGNVVLGGATLASSGAINLLTPRSLNSSDPVGSIWRWATPSDHHSPRFGGP